MWEQKQKQKHGKPGQGDFTAPKELEVTDVESTLDKVNETLREAQQEREETEWNCGC